jgi:alpha-tubulin suppressor-like RCC1 family protein
VLDIYRGKHSGSRGRTGKGYVRAAVPVMAAAVAAGLYLASPADAAATTPTAATPAGTALAWGNNQSGELGDGGTASSSVPVPMNLPAGTTVTAVSAGDDYNLALTSAGRVLAWGNNQLGQLGDGEGPNSSVPVAVDLPAGVRVTSVSAGSAGYSLAVTSAGGVLAWGSNNYGELGNGWSGGYDPVPVPVKLPAGTDVTAVASGAGYSLAVTSTGSVLVWGISGIYSNITPTPVNLPAGTRVTAVSSGVGDSLALTSTGRVLSWGQNNDGQLGNGTTAVNSFTPVWVDLPAATRVTAIAAGYYQSLALTSSGRILAWGDNAQGQLGDGTTTGSLTPVAVHLPAGVTVTAIADAGQGLALTSAGRILSWGDNYNGNLGDGGAANSSVPVAVDLPTDVRATAIAANEDSLAVVVRTSC